MIMQSSSEWIILKDSIGLKMIRKRMKTKIIKMSGEVRRSVVKG